jgi:hypothetical protein
MTKIRRRLSGGRVRWIIGLGLMVAFSLQCHELVNKLNQPSKVPGLGATVAVAQPESPVVDVVRELALDDPIERMAREEPLKLLREAQRRYRESVLDYTCIFRKQENLDGKLTEVQGTKVKYRDKSHSVYMEWIENPAKAKRVIYVEGKWTTKKGEPGALCEPAGAIAKLFVNSIVMPINGPEAKAASRRTIDQFGFAKGLELITKYCVLAQERGELKLTYKGQSTVYGRPTYVFERVLPYTGEDGVYPDRILVYQLDKETLLPVLCVSYADDNRQVLLGRYEYADVHLNEGLTDADFDGKSYGM